jgi:imidazolonepropionase-like amidohydrolase/ectoine hydroxylase-related dioxygenase (phytanoyl-CoA dioxygenase family)
VASLLSTWGLREGTGVGGWKVIRIGAPSEGCVAIQFAQDSREIEIRLCAASPAPKFVRVGGVDLSHGRIEQGLAKSAEALLTAMARWLSRHDQGAPLTRLLQEATTPAAVLNEGAATPLGPRATVQHVDVSPAARLLGSRLRMPAFPSPEAAAHLASGLTIPAEVIDSYRRDGFVLVRHALDRPVVEAARPFVEIAIDRNWDFRQDPEHNSGTYAKAFVQLWNIGLEDAAVRALSHAPRIGHLAAQLMGISGVRIFVENWLLKRPGEDATGWHQDSCVFPFDADAAVTAWIPLQPVSSEAGLIRFAAGSHLLPLVEVENISEATTEALAAVIESRKLRVVTAPAMEPGDVTFHHGLTIHGAQGNTTSERRDVLSLIMFADGARVKKPRTDTMQRQLDDLGDGLPVGAPAACVSWPRIYPTSDWAEQARHQWSRLRATVLPEDRVRDLWIHDGKLHLDGPARARLLAPEGGFVLSGLVDCHSHISFPHTREDASWTPAFMNAYRRSYAETGVTLLRDMGSDRDEVSRVSDEPGLPLVQAAGRFIVRDDAWPMQETRPENLRAGMLERIARGARWVKVFADFSEDYRGDSHTGFTQNDEVSYPVDVLAEAVRAVHQAGGRVAAHCFSRPGAEVSIQAKVDSLEHGWGVDADLVRQMSAGGIAWAPLLGIGRLMRAGALNGDPQRVKWIDESVESLRVLLPMAAQLGVQLLTGTDWFPSVTVADEVNELVALGVPVPAALAAGSYGARSWLHVGGIEQGARADLVLFRNDPRTDAKALFSPEVVVLGGRGVTPVQSTPRSS